MAAGGVQRRRRRCRAGVSRRRWTTIRRAPSSRAARSSPPPSSWRAARRGHSARSRTVGKESPRQESARRCAALRRCAAASRAPTGCRVTARRRVAPRPSSRPATRSRIRPSAGAARATATVAGGSFCWLAPSGRRICAPRTAPKTPTAAAVGFCLTYSTGQLLRQAMQGLEQLPVELRLLHRHRLLSGRSARLRSNDRRVQHRQRRRRAAACAIARGAGHTGTCFQSCRPGRGSCPSAEDGSPQKLHRIRRARQSSTGDAFQGSLCVLRDSPANQDGQPCLGADGSYVPWACLDGSQCDLSSSGDGLCHPLCEQGDACVERGLHGRAWTRSGCSTVPRHRTSASDWVRLGV